MVWNFTRWQEKRPHDWVLQSIFGEGRLHQPSVYTRLEAWGFDIVRESDRPSQYKLGAGAVVSGRLDGKIRGYKTEKFRPPLVLEIKTAQGYAYDRLNTIQDIERADHYYVRNYADQGHLYCFLENLPRGVIVLKSKATGALKPIPFELDFGRAEALLQRFERLQPLIDKQVDPPPIPFDRDVCGRCPFTHVCWPPKDFGAGAGLIEDAQLIEDLAAREKVKAARDQYEDLDKGIKARLKQLGLKAGAKAIAGAYLIQVAERSVKEFTVKARTDTIFDIERIAEEKPAAEPVSRPSSSEQSAAPTSAEDGRLRERPSGSSAAQTSLETSLFGERADKISRIDLARAGLKRPFSDVQWQAICRAICQTETLEQAEMATLEALRVTLDGVNRKDRQAIKRINDILVPPQ